MKKLLCLMLVILVCSACGKKDITECSYTGEAQEGMNVSYYYKITSSNGFVDKLESEEVITFQNEGDAKSFKEVMESTYEPYEELKYYNFNISLKNNTVMRKSSVNYAKIDMKKLQEITGDNSLNADNGKIKLEDMQNVYKKIGAICTSK